MDKAWLSLTRDGCWVLERSCIDNKNVKGCAGERNNMEVSVGKVKRYLYICFEWKIIIKPQNYLLNIDRLEYY